MASRDDVHSARRMLTRREAAIYLGVSCPTMSRWAKDRTGPAFCKLGNAATAAVRYPIDALDQFIAERTKAPKA